MKTDLVNRLRDYAASRKGEIADLTREAADAIEVLQAGWIPVGERLPREMERTLITIKTHSRVAVRSGFYHCGMFSNDNGDVWKCTDKEVIAWRPLPEPCEMEVEDENRG